MKQFIKSTTKTVFSNIVLLIAVFVSNITLAQVISNEEKDAAIKKIIYNSSDILSLERIQQVEKSVIASNQLDVLFLAKVTFVFKGKNINLGDTIIILLPNVGSVYDSMKEYPAHSRYPGLWSECNGNKICCQLFLVKSERNLENLDGQWKGRNVFELTPSQIGFASVRFRDATFGDKTYEVIALFDQQFKTINDWYNYLRQFGGLNVPEVK